MSTEPTSSKLPYDVVAPEALLDTLQPPAQRRKMWTEEVDKRDLHRLGLFTLLGVAAKAGVRQRAVPEDYWRPACHAADRYQQAYVDCPCGQTNVIALGSELVDCSGCERRFLYAGAEVLVYNGPAQGVN